MKRNEPQTGANGPQVTENTEIKSNDAATHPNTSICNIYQSVLPGLDPKLLQHNNLSPRHMAAIHLLLQGASDAEVASQLGFNRTTIYRWRNNPTPFRAELEAQRQALWQNATDRLGAMIRPALNLLERQLEAARTVDNTRFAIHIASTVLRLALRHRPPSAAALARERQRGFERALDAYVNAPLPGQTKRS